MIRYLAEYLHQRRYTCLGVRLTGRGTTLDTVKASPSETQRFGLLRKLILPMGKISFVLVLFLVMVATLLVRRFVNPLSDVIYVALEVAGGNLTTCIPMNGPQDCRALHVDILLWI